MESASGDENLGVKRKKLLKQDGTQSCGQGGETVTLFCRVLIFVDFHGISFSTNLNVKRNVVLTVDKEALS